MNGKWRWFLFFVLAVTTVGCDRVTKRMAVESLAGANPQSFLSDVVRLEYAENTGGFLSLGSDLDSSSRTAIFIVGTGLVLAAGLVAAIRLRTEGWRLAGISLALAGGVSNLLDRIAHGSVVDFLNVGVGGLRTGIFNVADIAILAGACMLMLPPRRGVHL